MTMTLREVFDTVKAHLLTQNAKAIHVREDGDEACMYRGPNGTKCAVGCLIKDEFYSTSLEGLPASYSEVQDALKKSGVTPKALGSGPALITYLQYIHDNHPVEEWPERLDRLERDFGLNHLRGPRSV